MTLVTGQNEIIANLMRTAKGAKREAIEAVDKTCIDVSNHAKQGHEGNMAHANNRYRNITSNLTQSISPEIIEITDDLVDGIVKATQEYAYSVETGVKSNVMTGRPNRAYPFLFPALAANNAVFIKRMKNIL